MFQVKNNSILAKILPVILLVSMSVSVLSINSMNRAIVRTTGISIALIKQAAKAKAIQVEKARVTVSSALKFTQPKINPISSLAPRARVLGAKTVITSTIVPVIDLKNYYTQALKFTTALMVAGLGSAVTYAYLMSEIEKHSSVSEQYSINVMWINRNLNADQKYIYPTKDRAELYEKLINPIVQWAIKNPGRTVNLWYDSQVTTVTAINNTKYLIWLEQLQQLRFTTVVLKDIRDLQKVRECPKCVASYLPVYFRADLLRVIATLEMVKKQPNEYFIYADLDMEPISDSELFDSETKAKLVRYGLVLADADSSESGVCNGWENGFHMVDPKNTIMLSAMNDILVEKSIKVADELKERIDGGYIYSQYRVMWWNFLEKEEKEKIKRGEAAKDLLNRIWLMHEDARDRLFGNPSTVNKRMVRPSISHDYNN